MTRMSRGLQVPAVSPALPGTAMLRAAAACCGALLLLLAIAPTTSRAAAAGGIVQVPSFDQRASRAGAGTELVLPGHWFPAPGASTGTESGSARAPAMLLLHGCGGLFDRGDQLAARYTDLTARLNMMGVHALALDSLTPRGERELCTQRTGSRQVTMLQRRRDVLGALQWLAAQPGVDPTRIGVLGWSNGGSTVLTATNLRQFEVSAAPVRRSLAVAFYPGCEAELQRGYQPSAPLLLLLGESDDWTPAAPCKALAAGVAAARPASGSASGAASAAPAVAISATVSATPLPGVELEAYAGAYHGFDGTAPLRLRRDVPNGARPGQGVHVGADAAARAAAALRLDAFLRAHWALP